MDAWMGGFRSAEHKLLANDLCHQCIPYNPFYREVIVQGSVRWPNGLALDLVLDRFLNWTQLLVIIGLVW